MIAKEEIKRYSRQISLPAIGMEGQKKLKNASVLVIGAGGLGCPVLLYLSAIGVGKIGIVDFDTVDETNLHRQILFDDSDIGKSKSEIAKVKLQKQNPFVHIDALNIKLSNENAWELFSQYDIIVDGSDNFTTRYLTNDACFLLKKILVSGAVFKFEGQVVVFDFTQNNSPSYRCLFPSPPAANDTINCSAAGVVGILPGIIGTLMANETFKIITGIGKILSGKLLVINSLNVDFQELIFKRSDATIDSIPKTQAAFKKMNYDYFCDDLNVNNKIKEITAVELANLFSSKAKFQIVDVREAGEYPEIAELNDLKVPVGKIVERKNDISRNKKVVVICKTGVRSAEAIRILQNNFEFENLFLLKGGVMEWVRLTNKIQKV